jgi:hypothetical protein
METFNKIYEVKSIENSLKDFDKKNVKIAIAHFENIDKVGEVIDKKAFDKTISITKNKWHFINHNADLFIGKFKDLYIENEYLVAVILIFGNFILAQYLNSTHSTTLLMRYILDRIIERIFTTKFIILKEASDVEP